MYVGEKLFLISPMSFRLVDVTYLEKDLDLWFGLKFELSRGDSAVLKSPIMRLGMNSGSESNISLIGGLL